jgi:glycosyltransferase involved in cell wall biosynthesis
MQIDQRRVLIVTPQPFYEDRGTPIAVRYVANALSEIGVEVDLLAFPLGQDVDIDHVTVSRCGNLLGLRGVPIGFSWQKVVLDMSLWRAFARRLATCQYSMVHAVEEAAYMASVLCPRFNQPFIYDMASAIPVELRTKRLLGSAPAQRMLQAVERRVLRTASHVVCSTGLADYVRTQAPGTPVTEWRFPALSTPVDPREVEALRDKLLLDPDQQVALYSGSFASYQGIDLLLEAFERARQSAPDLVLVCVGATDRDLVELARQRPLDIDANLRIVPRQPREKIPAYIELADFLVLPRMGGGNIPLKLYDYMASGKPIVATRQAGSQALLDDTRAFICEPDAGSLAEAMVKACNSPRKAAAVAQESAQFARRNFGWNPFVEFVGNTYSTAIGMDRLHGGNLAA